MLSNPPCKPAGCAIQLCHFRDLKQGLRSLFWEGSCIYTIYKLFPVSLFLTPFHGSSHCAEPVTSPPCSQPSPLPCQPAPSLCQLCPPAQTCLLPSFPIRLGTPSRQISAVTLFTSFQTLLLLHSCPENYQHSQQ